MMSRTLVMDHKLCTCIYVCTNYTLSADQRQGFWHGPIGPDASKHYSWCHKLCNQVHDGRGVECALGLMQRLWPSGRGI